MADSSDAHLQLKKRARRRLVGAIAFAGLAAIVLPMVMDEEPKQQVQDVQIRIPDQDKTPFNPKLVKPSAAPVVGGKQNEEEKEEVASVAPPPVQVKPAANVVEKPVEKQAEKQAEKKIEKPVEKKAEKKSEAPAEKNVEKAPAKTLEKPVKASGTDTQRAAAILGDKPEASSVGASSSGQYVILIGAFSNQANVKQLQTKIGELGVKVYTEPLDSPEGKKTRVRAGPFPSREAADKALDKMKRIGVNGVVAAK